MRAAMAVTCVAAMLALCAPRADAQGTLAPVPVSRTAADTPGRIRGTVFDSLLMRPIPRATVTLLTGARTTVADDRGRFSFDSVAVGAQTVAFSTPAFDSLGLGTLGTTVTMHADETVRMTVASPSLHTLASYRCRAENRIGPDSGIVWGTVRNERAGPALTAASALFIWYDLNPQAAKGVLINETRREVSVDASGTYFACGLPTDIAIASEGLATNAASGVVQYAIGAARIRRVDLLLSADMVLADTNRSVAALDSLAAERPRGRAAVRGVVLDTRERPLEGALVSIASADTSVRTDKSGRFLLGRLPAGTHMLEVRHVGSSPATQMVDLESDSVVSVSLQVSNVTTLATVSVRGTNARGADRVEYEQRRKLGFGYAIEGDALAKRPDIYSALSNFPGLRIERQGFGITALMKGSTFKPTCSPGIFLDGMPSDLEFVSGLPPFNYRAIEVYTSGSTVPLQYMTQIGCGAILFWSKNARW